MEKCQMLILNALTLVSYCLHCAVVLPLYFVIRLVIVLTNYGDFFSFFFTSVFYLSICFLLNNNS